MKKKLSLLLIVFLLVVTILPGFKIIDESSKTDSFFINAPFYDFDTEDSAHIENTSQRFFDGESLAMQKWIKNSSLKLNLRFKEDVAFNNSDFKTFDASGLIDLGNESHEFQASGTLLSSKTADKKTAYVGSLSGYIDGIETYDNHITLNVHYIPSIDKCYIPVAIGVLDDDGNLPTLVSFGAPFDEISKATDLYINAKLNQEAEMDIDEINNDSLSIIPLNDFNPSFAGTSYMPSNIGAVSLYRPKKMNSNGNYYMYAKVNSHTNKALSYIKSNVDSYAHTVAVTGGIVELKSNNINLRVYDSTPETKTYNVPIVIPYYSGGALQIFSTSLSYCPIKRTVTRLPESQHDNNVKWEYNQTPGINTNYTTTPNEASGGMAGRSYVSYLKNENTTITLTASGMVKYGYMKGTTHFVYPYNTATRSISGTSSILASGY